MNRLRLRFTITDMTTGEILLNKLESNIGFDVVNGYTAEKAIKKYVDCYSRGCRKNYALQFQIQMVSDFVLKKQIIF